LARQVGRNVPGVVGGLSELVDDLLLAVDDGAEPELLDIRGEVMDESQTRPPAPLSQFACGEDAIESRTAALCTRLRPAAFAA